MGRSADLEKQRGLLALPTCELEGCLEKTKTAESGKKVNGSWPEREELRTFWKLSWAVTMRRVLWWESSGQEEPSEVSTHAAHSSSHSSGCCRGPLLNSSPTGLCGGERSLAYWDGNSNSWCLQKHASYMPNSKPSLSTLIFNPYNFTRLHYEVTLFPIFFYSWGNWGYVTPRICQLTSSRAGIQAQAGWFPSLGARPWYSPLKLLKNQCRQYISLRSWEQ